MGFDKIYKMKNKLFIINFVEDLLFFFSPVGKQTIFFKKIPAPPPEYQMVRPLGLICNYIFLACMLKSNMTGLQE